MFSLLTGFLTTSLHSRKQETGSCLHKLCRAFLENDPHPIFKKFKLPYTVFLAKSRAQKISLPIPISMCGSQNLIPPALRMSFLLHCHCSSSLEETLVSTAMHRTLYLQQQAAPRRQYKDTLPPPPQQQRGVSRLRKLKRRRGQKLFRKYTGVLLI